MIKKILEKTKSNKQYLAAAGMGFAICPCPIHGTMLAAGLMTGVKISEIFTRKVKKNEK